MYSESPSPDCPVPEDTGGCRSRELGGQGEVLGVPAEATEGAGAGLDPVSPPSSGAAKARWGHPALQGQHPQLTHEA